jgi:hypothetical protein
MKRKNEQNQQVTMTKEQFVEGLAKSMYKAVRAYINQKDDVKEIVDDILDPNMEAEVDPDEVESNKRVNITRKSEHKHSKSHKGVHKLKKYIKRKG